MTNKETKWRTPGLFASSSPLPIRDFNGSNIDEYILKINKTNEFHGERKCLEEKIKGRKFLKSKFINDFKFFQDASNTCVAAKVRAEMKKTSYDVNLTISSDNEVLDAGCECAGGASPSDCKHVFAILHFIAEYCSKDLHTAPTEVLQQWHQPSKKVRCSPKKVEQFAAPISLQKKPKTGLNFSALAKLPYGCPLFSVLEDANFDHDEALYISSSIKLPLGNENTDVAFTVPLNLSEKELLFFQQKIQISKDDCHEVEKKTMSQNNDLWKKERKVRLTSSNFHRIISRRGNFDELSIYLLDPPEISHLPAIKQGKELEGYVKRKITTNFPEYQFRDVGFVINHNFPFLGASPDGLLFNADDFFLVEIKTVYSEKKVELSDLLQRSNFCLKQDDDGVLKLRKNHIYYHQIQGQLAVTNVACCLFVLHYAFDKEPFCEKIMRSQVYWEINFPKLRDFFFNYLKNVIKCFDN